MRQTQVRWPNSQSQAASLWRRRQLQDCRGPAVLKTPRFQEGSTRTQERQEFRGKNKTTLWKTALTSSFDRQCLQADHEPPKQRINRIAKGQDLSIHNYSMHFWALGAKGVFLSPTLWAKLAEFPAPTQLAGEASDLGEHGGD